MWIDAHAHLYDLSTDELSAVVNASKKAGVTRILNAGNSIETSLTVIKQRLLHPLLLSAAGVSPFDADKLPVRWEKTTEALLSRQEIVAIGETGIDSTSQDYPDMKLQMRLFEYQLSIASSRNLPVIVHSRGCEGKAVDVCKSCGVSKAMFHCFTGSLEDLKKCLDAGYYVSFSGIITFKNASLSHLVEYIPCERMLIETDSPYLAPVPFRGKKNSPELVIYTGKKVAEIKNLSWEETGRILTDNFDALFLKK
jgi:TatD DNase family protein